MSNEKQQHASWDGPPSFEEQLANARPVTAEDIRAMAIDDLTDEEWEPLAVAEMRSGAELARWGEARRTHLEALIGRAVISYPDDETDAACADLKAACWRDGHALAHAAHAADLWIAVTAVRRGLPLVSHDGVFKHRSEFELITELPDDDVEMANNTRN